MSKESLVFVSGFVVFLTPFLGIPGDWKEIVFICVGVLLMILGYALRRNAYLRSIQRAGGERRGEAFVEHVLSEKAEQTQESESEK